ncbi:MAG: shikimate kinase [Bryobacterales bacterium]|nr:shikimate kinase [Bryobacterales bacterium]
MNLRLKRTPGLFLVGFMGSGKTTIGRLLAEELGWTFVDLDDDIEARQQAAISRIFEERGEAEFRRVERECLEARVKQIRASQPLVVSLGGGAYVQAKNRELIAASGVAVWLDCPFERIEKRVAGFTHRPLARDAEAFRQLFVARQAAYAMADYHVAIASDDPGEAVREILKLQGLFER